MYPNALSLNRISPWRSLLSFAAVVAIHAVLLILLFSAAIRPQLAQPIQSMTVRLLEVPPPPPPAAAPLITPPKPLPSTTLQRPQTPAPATRTPPRPTADPLPLLTAAPTADSASTFSVAGPTEKVPAAPTSGSATAPVSGVRFDADYLRNPKPIYPALSRRHGEEGKVVLRVQVSAQGAPLGIEIRQSSGYPRLDEAARSAVEQWRFVPARQNNEAIEASVLVPLQFTLNNEAS